MEIKKFGNCPDPKQNPPRVAVKCEMCGGEGKYETCDAKGEYYFKDCPECDGTGTIWKDQR